MGGVPETSLFTTVPSPIGELLLLGARTEVGTALSGLYCDPPPEGQPPPEARRDDAAFADALDQLAAYFAGERQDFDLLLAAKGTSFQHEVWTALRDIPYGTTTTYGALARQLGRPVGAARAVGACNGRNPIGIVVPCHRVIGSTGNIIGYAGGLDRKRWLLGHEARVADHSLTLFA
ncbi:MAG: methylated-DNA-[protein]-cysteine S-methyltransferase [Actinomycetota bacterium]|jgi:methylated-DNA-[protein]-cysteine S-methyltransferase|nr:methylated-DNA-[protein]-cysteine S-methyltransferase [Actinomycetota bacterium]